MKKKFKLTKNFKNLSNRDAGNIFASIFDKLINPIADGFMWFGSIFLVIIVVLTIVDIFTRLFFKIPIQGSLEIVELTLVCVTFSGMVFTTFKRGNVRVDVLISRFSKRSQFVLDSAMILIGALLCAVLSWQLWLGAMEWISVGRYSATLQIPVAPFKILAAIAAGVISLFLFMDFIRSIIKEKYKEK